MRTSPGRLRLSCLLLLIPLLSACADPNGSDPLACSPAFAPGTAAYKSCLLRQGYRGDDGSEGYGAVESPPPPPAQMCIPLGIDSSCN